MKRIKVLVSVLCFVFTGMAAVYGQSSEKVTFHGFGGWGYGKTDGADYMYGDKKGNYNHAQFFLNVNADLTEKLSIIAQYGFVQNNLGTQFEFDYAFAEWKFSDQLRFRIGKVKHAFGIYGEVLEVGTLRPFMNLAQGIYGSQGYVGKGLNGAALTGTFNLKQGWGITYDLYAGQLKTVAEVHNIILFLFYQDPKNLNDSGEFYEKNISDLLGGRLVISTPLEGLSFGFSGYFGQDKGVRGQGAQGLIGKQKSYGFHLEYLSTDLLFRGEYMKNIMSANFGLGQELEPFTNCFYAEAAYKFTNHWQAAIRYEWLKGDIPQIDMKSTPIFFQKTNEHQDLAIGLNYWFSQNLVLKASYHMVKGLRSAWPQFDNPIAFLMGNFDNKTKLFQLGAQFSF